MSFTKLCRNVAIGDCRGFGACGDFVAGDPGFFGQPQCDNLMGWR